MSSDRLIKLIVANYGKVSFFEWLHAEEIAMPYFDVDGSTNETTADALLADALDGIDRFFGFTPANVRIAESHGGTKLSYRFYVPGYRMVIGDMKKRLVRLGLDKNRPFDGAVYGVNQKLRTVGSYKTPEDRRVLRLYEAEVDAAAVAQTLVKVVEAEWPMIQEPGTLKSVPPPPPPPPPPQVTATPAAPIPATPPAPVPIQPAKSTRGEDPMPPTETPPASSPSTSSAVAVMPAPKRARGRPPKQQAIPQEHHAVLLGAGFTNPKFVSATDKGYAFTADNRDRCPNCGHDHERHNWWLIEKEDVYMVASYSDRCKTSRIPKVVESIVPACETFEDSLALLNLDQEQAGKLRGALHYHQTVVKVACYRPECLACERHHDCTTYTAQQIIPRHCWSVRNDDNSCRGRIFHHTSRLADKLHSLFVCPNEESLIGLFLEGHVGTIHVERHTRTTYLWDCAPRGGGRWRKLTATEFESHVGHWLNTLLQGIAGLAEFKDHEKAVKQAQGKVTPGGIAKLKQQIQGRISLQAMQGGQQEAVMDGNPLLLGAGANVIELKAVDEAKGGHTTILRPARPEDLVTKSVGYDIPDTGFEDAAAVEAVFAQIYPVEEERRFFQLYGGYCLLGNNPAKGFLCLTDRRKGDNGKSTAVRLLRRALGDDYVIDNKQNLLYEARYSNNVNAHDAGMLAFEGKRLAIMEELSASRTLDTSVMKQLTGGEARISVRAAGAADTRAMAWSAKLITVFNEGCAPRFKAEDDAFTKRMIVMPHRSFFCKDAAAKELHNGEANTFDADGAKIERAEAEPWKVLAWFLEGLEQYWASGHVEFQAPAVCREWAGDLVQEQDMLRAWADDHVEVGQEDDFVPRKDLELAVKAAEIHIRPMQLKKRMLSMYGSRGVSVKTDHFTNGMKHASVWLKLKWR